ncbi:MAG: TfoX/Sxy family protein [archaeon]|nr:TfoX/Sxy family protein [archaeon]
MPSGQPFLEKTVGIISAVGNVTYRKMMGEYLLYLDGKLFGGIYDDRLLLKKTPSLLGMMPDAEFAIPYEGAKEMVFIPDPEKCEGLAETVREMCKTL